MDERKQIAFRRFVATVAVAAVVFAGSAAAAVERKAIGDGLVAARDGGGRLFLETRPEPREGLLAFSRRLCGTDAAAADVAAANGGATRLLAGVRYRVPLERLKPELRRRVAAAFPAAGANPSDQGKPPSAGTAAPAGAAVRVLATPETPLPADLPPGIAAADGWRHTATPGDTLWHLAEVYTGQGENFRAIREYNELPDEALAPGTAVTIPAELLLPAYRATLPAGSVLARRELAEPTGADFGLEYTRDAQGEVALYRLRPGEALYSSVVVRFTGRLIAADVNALASEIAARNGIPDVTDIPVGYRVKVPHDLLLPEFLPDGHPRRREWEASRQASAAFTNQVRSRDLEGITVVLDPGHGGRDIGASQGGVWESLYVYDVAQRVRRLLAEHTAATVAVTTRDGVGDRVPDRDVLGFSHAHAVTTDPPYPIEDSKTGVYLRCYLANSLHRRATAASGDPGKTVFVSIHADSLHPSVRGATVYIPGVELTGGAFSRKGPEFDRRREVREQPRVELAYRDRVASEGLSRELAAAILGEFADRGLAIHPNKPIREKIIRQRSAWVPAVLRYNTIPAKILLEVANLANAEDRRLLQTQAFRQQVAEAVVAGILDYYDAGGAKRPPGQQVAAAR